MSKKKIASIAILSVLALAVAFTVWYLIAYGKEETIALFDRIKDFINQPLPIIGVSTAVILCFVLKMVSMSSYGRSQIEQVKKEMKAGNDSINSKSLDTDRIINGFKDEMGKRNELYNEKIEELEGKVELIADYFSKMPNKKAQKLTEDLRDGKDE